MRLGHRGTYIVNAKGVKNGLEIEVTALREFRSKISDAIGRLKLEEKILRAALECLRDGKNDQTHSSMSASTEADVAGGSDSEGPDAQTSSKRSREEEAEDDTCSESSGEVRETLAKRRRLGGTLLTGKIHKIGTDAYTVADPNERLILEWAGQAERDEMAAGNLGDWNVSEIDALVNADKSEGLNVDSDGKGAVTGNTDVDVDEDLALVEEVDALLREFD
ncbi:hypothetical protein BSKO_05968 [Bryopsis sp. KO-2023]|nr:hypothetical protein BSKO_05968 [Bryopsis sp. KO-2023]